MWQTKYASAVPINLGLELNLGRAVKAIFFLGVRSPWTMSDMVKYGAALWSFFNSMPLYYTMSDIASPWQ